MRKNIQSVIPKPHLHFMQKTSAKFQNNQKKTVRGIVPTRYWLSIHFISISCKKETKFTKQKKWEKIIKVLYQNHMHIFIPHWKHLQSNRWKTKRSCAHKVPTFYTLWKHFIPKKKAAHKAEKVQKKSNHMHIFIPCWKQSVENCKRSCVHKVPSIFSSETSTELRDSTISLLKI